MSTNPVFLAFPLLIALQPNAAVGARVPEEGRQYHYCYFKKELPLALEGHRIAVLRSVDDNAAMSGVLGRFGIAEEDGSQGQLPGWRFASAPPHARGDAGIRNLVQRLAVEAEGIDFASPVFLDEYGPFIITAELLVGFDDGVTARQAVEILVSVDAGAIIEAHYARMNNVYRVRADSRDGFRVLETANTLAERPDVKFAEPNAIRTAKLSGIPNDPLFPRQWWLHNSSQNIFEGADVMCCSVPCAGNCWPPCPQYCLSGPCAGFPGGAPDFDVNALDAWETTTGDPSIIVVVFDQGIELAHPDLMIDPGLGRDFTGEGGGGYPIRNCDFHGTAVAGIIRGQANNGIGVAGLAPDACVASARVIQSTSTTSPCGSSGHIAPTWIIDGLQWAEELGAPITNHSYATGESAALTTKLAQTRAAGILHFAAAGNCGCQVVGYPARLPFILTVSGTQWTGDFWPESTFGPEVDFSAPGEFIYSTDPTGDRNIGGFGASICNDYFVFRGTSFAAPMAAGVAALVLSVDPTLTADEVELLMRRSAVDLGPAGYDERFGWGMVNAFSAVVRARNCLADFDDNGNVELSDLATLLAHFGGSATSLDGDVNGDGVVDLTDLSLLLAAFGAACP